VEEEEGGLALWISYLITGAGANLVSWLILPRVVVSVGASGAVFGLFAVSVLVKVMISSSS
jgi:membrane associated rhomboid family serine protease